MVRECGTAVGTKRRRGSNIPETSKHATAVQWYQNIVWQSSSTRIWYGSLVVPECGMVVQWYQNMIWQSLPKGGMAQVYLVPQSTLWQSSGTRIWYGCRVVRECGTAVGTKRRHGTSIPGASKHAMAVQWYQNMVWLSSGTRIWYGSPVNTVWQSAPKDGVQQVYLYLKARFDSPVVPEYGMAVQWYQNMVRLSSGTRIWYSSRHQKTAWRMQVYLVSQSTVRQSVPKCPEWRPN